MLLALLITIVAGGVAVARGGSLERLARTRFSFAWLLFTGLIFQVVFDVWDPSWLSRGNALAVVLASYAAVLGFLVANNRLPGMLLAAIGLGLNVLVIGLNGAMPVSTEASRVAGIDPAEFRDVGVKHEILGPHTVTPWLADVLAIPGAQIVFSVGDVVLGAGLGRLVYGRAKPREKEGA